MLALATPFVADSLSRIAVSPGLQVNTEIQPANEAQEPVPTKLAEIALSQLPDLVVPVRELTGLDLPDLRLADLKRLPLPNSVPLPDLSPDEAARPVNPEELPPDLADQLGATVKEITRDTPFSMVALTGSDLSTTAARIRAKLPDGSWGPWETLDVIDGQPEGAQAGTEPVYVGQTTAVQVLSTSTTPVAENAENTERPTALGRHHPTGGHRGRRHRRRHRRTCRRRAEGGEPVEMGRRRVDPLLAPGLRRVRQRRDRAPHRGQ